MDLGERCQSYLQQLATITEGRTGLTRLYLTKEHESAFSLIKKWMEEVGLATEIDNAGNLIGNYFCGDADKPTLIMGSHQDSVINGGIYDGMLGIVAPLVALQEIDVKSLPYNLKVVAFGDEEGVRFNTTYLGSRALTGNFPDELLEIEDHNGIKLRDALIDFKLNPEKISEAKLTEIQIDYVEIHIEQGPILEKEGQSVGIVNGINAFHRYRFTVNGKAGHAGTVPMGMRQDAGIVMAHVMTFIRKIADNTEDLVATVGKIQLEPGAINVIPDKAVFSLDIRAPREEIITHAVDEIDRKLEVLSKSDGLTYQIEQLARGDACQCDDKVKELIHESVEENGMKPIYLNSGAGHDAQEMSRIANVGMLFARCREGISHHPDEFVETKDLKNTVKVVRTILKNYNKGSEDDGR